MQKSLVLTSGDHQKETVFISCKWPHSLCKIGALIPSEGVHPALWTWARMNSISTQRKASLPSDAATCPGVVYGLIWPRTGIDMHEMVYGGLTWGCTITENALSGCVPVCIPPCTPIEEPNGHQAESSEQYCEACHHKDLRPTQQADLGQFIWSIEAHLLLYGHHSGDFVSLSSGITGDSRVTCHSAEEVGQQLQQRVVGKRFAASKHEEEG